MNQTYWDLVKILLVTAIMILTILWTFQCLSEN